MQLKSCATFSASAFVSKSAGVRFVWELPEHPIKENDIEIMIVVKILLRFFIFLALPSSSSLSLLKYGALSLKTLQAPEIKINLNNQQIWIFLFQNLCFDKKIFKFLETKTIALLGTEVKRHKKLMVSYFYEYALRKYQKRKQHAHFIFLIARSTGW